MYVDNITSENMTLTYEGKAMQIKVYEDLLKEKDKEIERLNNIINELEKWAEDYRFANIFKDKLQELKGSDKE